MFVSLYERYELFLFLNLVFMYLKMGSYFVFEMIKCKYIEKYLNI